MTTVQAVADMDDETFSKHVLKRHMAEEGLRILHPVTPNTSPGLLGALRSFHDYRHRKFAYDHVHLEEDW